jgi:hypothetical protein
MVCRRELDRSCATNSRSADLARRASFEVGLFCFRGKAPVVYIAQPEGLGQVKHRNR